ncbi:MAG: hypothetical protein A3K12_06230 [Candidatus Rokubacteria bacterium RIFCSPLOWO2_12_FULL_71_19]|nr:MAG: hypothetical protein A3K12_06230 [Candidatus Rokubacteria bacterium RIFCSPLOWO2_12_FULL_71_19]
MAVELAKSGDEWGLTLSGVVDIFDAVALQAAAQEACGSAAPGAIVVRLGSLEAVDTASTQVLLALKRDLGGGGQRIRFEAIPDPVARYWSVGGLADLLC